MRESRRRSLARLPLPLAGFALLVTSACTPQLALSGRPEPCGGNSVVCPATGVCIPPVPAGSDVSASDDASKGKPWYCPSALTVRQDSSILLAAPLAKLSDVTASGAGDLTAVPELDAAGNVFVRVSAPRGSPAGDYFGNDQRLIKISTVTEGKTYVREVLVIVSFITAASNGDDSNDNGDRGVLDQPFRTFRHAAALAQAGDTIVLRGSTDDVATGSTAPNAGAPVVIQDGVTVTGVDTQLAPVGSDVTLVGDATLQNLQLIGSRLVITAPGSHVALGNDGIPHGVTIDAKASVAAGSVGTDLAISGHTAIGNDPVGAAAPLSSLLVQAAGATVTLEDPGSSVGVTDLSSNVETIRFEGGAQSLSILNGANVANLPNATGIRLVGSVSVLFDGVRFINPIAIEDPASDVQIQGTVFGGAPFTFQGHSLTILANSQFNNSLVTFQGHDLTIKDSIFTGQGIIQDNVGSTASLNNVSVTGYEQFGFKLRMGQVDIATGAFVHALDAPLSPDGVTGPWALRVEAAADSDSSLSAMGTTFDGSPPTKIDVVGPTTVGTIVSVTDSVPISIE